MPRTWQIFCFQLSINVGRLSRRETLIVHRLLAEKILPLYVFVFHSIMYSQLGHSHYLILRIPNTVEPGLWPCDLSHDAFGVTSPPPQWTDRCLWKITFPQPCLRTVIMSVGHVVESINRKKRSPLKGVTWLLWRRRSNAVVNFVW